MKKGISALVLTITLQTLSAQYFFHKQWDKRYGGTSSDGSSWIAKTNDGGIILAGTSQSEIGGDKTQPNWDTTLQFGDYWIVKIDSDGHKEWDKRYGGTSQDNLNKIRQTFDGGYILGGASFSGLNGDKTQGNWGSWDYWIVKTDALGSKEWDKRFGGTFEDYILDIQQTTDSGYIFGGYSSSGISGDKTEDSRGGVGFYYDYWIVKVDVNGNKEWDKRFGGNVDDFLTSIVQTKDKGYILGGFSSSDSSGDKTQFNYGGSDIWIVKVDSIGNKLWDKRLGGNSGEYSCYSLIKTPDDGFMLGGSSYSGISGDKTQASWGDLDYWVVKIDSIGNKQWDKDYGGSGTDRLYSLNQTNDNGYLLAGSSMSMSASGNKSENNLGSRQTWVIKVNSIGNKQWDRTIFTTGSESQGIALQTRDGCYIMGGYTNGDIGGYKTQPSWGGEDYWIVKFCDSVVTGLNEVNNTINISVYPNPFASDISISIQQPALHQATFILTNIFGQVLYQREEENLGDNYTKVLDLSPLPSGIYFIQVTTTVGSSVKQIVKQ